MKKRELKYNSKIIDSIDKIKQLYKHKLFYESLIPTEDSMENEPEVEMPIQKQSSASVVAPKTGSYLESFKAK